MNKQKKEIFETIFQEARVVDFDFCRWDKFIRIVAVAPLMPTGTDKRFPVFNVDFNAVSHFKWVSNHLDVERDEEDCHCQWNISESEVIKDRDFYKIKLMGKSPAPEVSIRCRSVNIGEIGRRVIDMVNPGWNKPNSPLARPGFLQIYSKLKTHR